MRQNANLRISEKTTNVESAPDEGLTVVTFGLITFASGPPRKI